MGLCTWMSKHMCLSTVVGEFDLDLNSELLCTSNKISILRLKWDRDLEVVDLYFH